ncbi:hypothetical protein WJX73_006961 [Symbiochloris irregularis]|uniref:Uncharacterized protein n=1 Tax=Symbiochloris irregularis TaxID=706552 RepID=A0AAW1P3I3_9CHLO
MEYASKLGLQ